MNLDFNNIALIAVSLFAGYFGFAYMKARFEDRMRSYTQRVDDFQAWMDRENERILDRVRTLENSVSNMRYSGKCDREKNYYNTEV
jgi:hypothetical protein